MIKSATWVVTGIMKYRLYEVKDSRQSHIVDFDSHECTCKKWQLSGLPCGHVCAVSRAEGLTNNSKWAIEEFLKTKLKETYEEKVYPLRDISEWSSPDNVQEVKPPVMSKRQSGRPKNKDRIPSQGEGPKKRNCGRCGNPGHNRRSCTEPVVQKKVYVYG